ncbi:hypothetical protein DPMN_013489 [Dreissena polymorpha]|uniref:Uncharacterized protein n=1 Tax=Dreissena polymorpha TaxID=45954 RepID=A0A9D4N810_DREPO|nr:hypothetical protein DPMN_013489 [Dreissena polymorpha]
MHFRVNKFVEELSTDDNKNLIHSVSEALHETVHGAGKGSSTSVGFRAPSVVRTWSARGGGSISNLVSSRFASGSQM